MDPIPRQGMLDGAHDSRVLCSGYIVPDQKLLVELFRSAQAGIVDFDIAIGVRLLPYSQSHEVYHAAREVIDTYRQAHVQYKHVSTPSHRTSLNHELCSLGNGHEIP